MTTRKNGRRITALVLAMTAAASLASAQGSKDPGQPGTTPPADRDGSRQPGMPDDSNRKDQKNAVPDKAAMDKMIAQEQPGEMQKWLKKYEGSWRVEVTHGMGSETSRGMVNNRGKESDSTPTKASGVETGTAKTEIKHDRHACTKVTGTMHGQSFEGMGALAYNNVAQRFESVWQDSLHTGIGYMTGQLDSGKKELTLTGECTDPSSGQAATVRSVTRWINDNEYVTELFMRGSDGGSDQRMATMKFTRESGLTAAPDNNHDGDRDQPAKRDQR